MLFAPRTLLSKSLHSSNTTLYVLIQLLTEISILKSARVFSDTNSSVVGVRFVAVTIGEFGAAGGVSAEE